MFRLRKSRPVKDAALEADLFKSRAATGFGLIALALLVLIARYFYLQVLEHDEYHTRSEANRIKVRPLPPTRGLIFDRNGKLLAENVPQYRLEVTPQQAGDVAATLRASRASCALSDEDIARFKELRALKRAFDSVPLKLLLTESELAHFAVQRYRFPASRSCRTSRATTRCPRSSRTCSATSAASTSATASGSIPAARRG
jgi:penicillin-binding protein 2